MGIPRFQVRYIARRYYQKNQVKESRHTKVMRGLKTIESASAISAGLIVHYNFLRPHVALRRKTPAAVAGLKLPFKTWKGLVDYLWRNVR